MSRLTNYLRLLATEYHTVSNEIRYTPRLYIFFSEPHNGFYNLTADPCKNQTKSQISGKAEIIKFASFLNIDRLW